MPDLPGYDELAARLELAEQTLDAIQSGAVDALVVSTPSGPQIFTLHGADEFYRALVEQMGEGAAAVQRDGTVLYANEAMAQMLGVEAQSLTGSVITDHLDGADRATLLVILAGTGIDGVELRLGRHGSLIDVSLSAREIAVVDGTHTMCLIATDNTELRQAEAAQRRAQLASERERVARDLHDVVIQSLFAVGLRLHNLADDLDPKHELALKTIVDDVDDTVTAIRTTIFGLKSGARLPVLSAAVQRLVDETPVILGFAAELVIVGALDTLTPAAAYTDVTAALREALSNVARHAGASQVSVHIEVTPTDLVLRVIDNGRGIPAHHKESGLANLRARAEAHQGSCIAIANEAARGTCVTWHIPVVPLVA